MILKTLKNVVSIKKQENNVLYFEFFLKGLIIPLASENT